MAVKKRKAKKVIKIKKTAKTPKKVLPKKQKKIIKKLKPKKKVVLKKKNKRTKTEKVIKTKKTTKLVKVVKTVKKISKVKKKIKKPTKKIKPKVKKKVVKKSVVKKSKPVKRKSKPIQAQISAFPAETFFKAKIKVVGMGGGGGSIVSEIGRSLEKATFVVADTDFRALKKRPGIKPFCFGESFTRGLGTGANPELAKQAANEVKEKIGGLFKDQDIIIFIASLGGGVGSGATQVFAEAARDFGGITFGIFTLPFKFEGKSKQKIASDALRELRGLFNVSLVIPNEKIFKLIDINTPITSAFSIVNKNLIESLESLIDLIYNPGVINIDFADLRTILRGRGNLAFLNTVEESGKDRADQTCQKIFTNPLYQNNSFTAEKILFNIAGGDNLSMFEVEKISRVVSETNPKAKIIFGISKNSKLKNKIKTTLLMTGAGQKGDIIKEKVAVEEKIIPEIIPESVKEEKVAVEEKVLTKKIDKKKEKKEVKVKVKEQKKDTKPKKEKKVKKKKETLIPVLNIPTPVSAGLSEKRINVIQLSEESNKKGVRRNALEVRKAQEAEENKRALQEKEWEIPAFLRKVKFKS